MFDDNVVKKIQTKNLLPSLWITLLCLLIFVCSYVGFVVHVLNVILWICLVLLVAIGASIKLEFGAIAILIELFLGGHGYLFSISLFGNVISIRIALFCVVALIWLIDRIRKRRLPRILSISLRYPFFSIVSVIVMGILVGIVFHHGKLVFFDANAYFAVAYIAIFLDAIATRHQRQRIIRIASSAFFALAIVTILFLGIYTVFHYDISLKSAITLSDELYNKLNSEILSGNIHLGQGTSIQSTELQLDPLVLTKTKPISYRWLLDSGTAEISYISGRFFRIFFPSQMYLLIYFFLTLTAALLEQTSKKFRTQLILVTIITFAAILIGYSRSYWLGLVSGGFILLCATFFRSHNKKRFLLRLTIALLLCLAIITITKTSSVITSRFDTIFSPQHDVASAHRIQLAKGIWNQWKQHPLIGSGYGTTIVFPTIFANGKILPTAFYIYEWAYFDVAVKTGLLGLFALFWFLFTLGTYMRRRIREHPSFFLGLLCSLIALCVANITTPIFTHPLGIGALGLFCLLVFYDPLPNSNRNLE